MSKLFDKERLASRILQETREQAPPAQSAESDREAKLHIRLLEATDANINQLNSRLERFREDLNGLAQTMETRKAAAQPEPAPAPSAESSSAGWFGRIIVFAIGLGIGALVMLRNTPPEPLEPPIDQSRFSAEAHKAFAAVEQGAHDWDAFSRPTRPAVAAVTPGPAKLATIPPPPVPPSPAPERSSPFDATDADKRAKEMDTSLKDAKENQANVQATELLDSMPPAQPKSKEEVRVMTSEPPLPKAEPVQTEPATSSPPVVVTSEPPAPKPAQKMSIVNRFVRPRAVPSAYTPPPEPPPAKKAEPEFKTVTPTNGQFTF